MNNNVDNLDALKCAIKNLDNFLWNIANNVICTICHELYTEAATSQCGHSYCLKCIKRLHATSRKGRINCPLCRHPIKRRAEVFNPLLSKIAEIISVAPAAFKEDVKKLTKNFEDVGEDLIKSSKISAICEEKAKEEVIKKGGGRRKGNMRQTTSNDSVVLCSLASNNGENSELKSVSQIESKLESYVSGSPDIEKKLRNVKGIPSKEKVTDWLKNVDGNIVRENDGGEVTTLPEPCTSRVNESGTRMIRVDYMKSKEPDGLYNDLTLTLGKDDDPYEFIASQRNTPPKRKRASRGRKRVIPQFEAIHSFGKNMVQKTQVVDTSGVFEDDNSSVGCVRKPTRTYSTRSSRNQIVDENKKLDTNRENAAELKLDSEGSSIVIENESDIAVSKSRLRRILSSSSDENSNSKKKPKLESSGGEKAGKSGGSSKCSESPGWSRVSNLKMDFETANKRRPCRKSLNISGGELSVNASKMKSFSDVSMECDKPITVLGDKDVYIEDLSQSSELVVGFDSQQNMKNDFREIVENMEKELQGIEELQEDQVHIENEDSKEPKSEVTRRSPNKKTIPFSLLGKIKKKKRASIVFIKMGKLAPYLRRCDTTVVKLLFPSKSKKKMSIGLQTEELPTEPLVYKDDTTVETRVNIGLQTTQCMSSSKAVQTAQSSEQKNVTIQTETIVPSQMFEEFNTPKHGKTDAEIDFDTELQDELNKTWAATQAVKNDKEETDHGYNDDGVLMQNAINNIKLDLSRIRECRTSGKQDGEQGEESDSDIFIEQTPPREATAAGSGRSEDVAENPDESFLIFSDCDNNIPDSIKAKCDTIENDENNQNEMNQELRKDRKICIASSGIRNRKLIQSFVDKFKVEHLNSPKREMTHLVVGLHENEDDELVPYCTPKFLYAIANKKWIVSEAWLAECLKSNRIVEEDKFESVDPVGGNACNIARLSTGFLLENCEIHLFGKFVSITKEEFAELIRDCGGTIVSLLSEFSYQKKKIRMILVDGTESTEDYDFKSLSARYRTLVMSRDVAIMSIQSYKMVNFTAFVQHPFSTGECVKWGYPLELVNKDPDSDSESQP